MEKEIVDKKAQLAGEKDAAKKTSLENEIKYLEDSVKYYETSITQMKTDTSFATVEVQFQAKYQPIHLDVDKLRDTFQLALGFWTVVVIMAIPGLVIAAIVVVIYKIIKRARSNRKK